MRSLWAAIASVATRRPEASGVKVTLIEHASPGSSLRWMPSSPAIISAENANVPRSSGKAVTGHTSDYGIRTVSDVASAMLSVQDSRDQLSRKRESVIY